MYQNTIYICISWYSKICWFPVKNADVSRIQGVCHVIHMLFGSSLGKLWLPSFIIVGFVWQILGKGAFLPIPFLEQPQKGLSWIKLITKKTTETGAINVNRSQLICRIEQKCEKDVINAIKIMNNLLINSRA